MLNRRYKVLSARQLRRNQLPNFKKLRKQGVLVSSTANPGESGLALTHAFSNTAAVDISASVSARLFDVPKAAIPQQIVAAAFGKLGQVDVPDPESNLTTADCVVYKIAIFGNFGNSKQFMTQVTERLAAVDIEPVFVLPRNAGTPADCEGMLVVPGRNTPHSASARRHYESTVPVMVVSGYGVERVVTAAVEFRNKLVENKGRISA